jgi:hypothetical protein
VRQATFDGDVDQMGCEKSQRDRHVDLADAAFFPGGDLLTPVTAPGKDFLELSPATGDGSDELGAGLRADRANIPGRCGLSSRACTWMPSTQKYT